MKTVLGAILAILLTPAATLVAQDSSGGDQFQTIRFHRVHLRNGNVIDGNLVSLSDDTAILKFQAGEMSIKRGMIEKIEYIKMRSLLERPPVIVPKKDAEKKPETPSTESRAKPNDALSPLATPAGVPQAAREAADAIIMDAIDGKSSDRQVARRLEELGPEVAPYLWLLLEQRAKALPAAGICAALKKFEDPKAIPGLTAALREGQQSEDRRQALQALIQLAPSEIDKLALSALDDPAADVWREAKGFLVAKFRKGGADEMPNLVARAMVNAENKIGYAITLGDFVTEPARKELLYLLSSGDDFAKRAAVQGLELHPKIEDGPEVARFLGVRDAMLKQEVCLYVGKLKYTAAVPDLIALLGDEAAGVVSNAHWALKEITGEKLAADRQVWQSWFDSSTLKKDLQK
jgi:hypothetical protein